MNTVASTARPDWVSDRPLPFRCVALDHVDFGPSSRSARRENRRVLERGTGAMDVRAPRR